MQRVTVMVPEALIEAANHVMVVLGKATGLNSYRGATYQDADGSLYAVSSGMWTDTQIVGVSDPSVLAGVLVETGLPEGVDLAMVQAAQAAFVLTDTLVAADTTKITAFSGDNPHAALAAWGVSPIEADVV